eukprot:284818925_3
MVVSRQKLSKLHPWKLYILGESRSWSCLSGSRAKLIYDDPIPQIRFCGDPIALRFRLRMVDLTVAKGSANRHDTDRDAWLLGLGSPSGPRRAPPSCNNDWQIALALRIATQARAVVTELRTRWASLPPREQARANESWNIMAQRCIECKYITFFKGGEHKQLPENMLFVPKLHLMFIPGAKELGVWSIHCIMEEVGKPSDYKSDKKASLVGYPGERHDIFYLTAGPVLLDSHSSQCRRSCEIYWTIL